MDIIKSNVLAQAPSRQVLQGEDKPPSTFQTYKPKRITKFNEDEGASSFAAQMRNQHHLIRSELDFTKLGGMSLAGKDKPLCLVGSPWQ
jgi:hypothetical protein